MKRCVIEYHGQRVPKWGSGRGGGAGCVLGKERRAAEGKLLGESLGGDIQALEAIWGQVG